MEDFYAWQGYNGNPAVGTVNHTLGFSTENVEGSTRYTFPMVYKDSTADYDSYGMPIEGTIVGVEQRVISVINDDCPSQHIPTGLITRGDFLALDWLPEPEEE